MFSMRNTYVIKLFLYELLHMYTYLTTNDGSDMWEIYIFNVVLLQNIEIVLYSKPVVWEA